MVKELFCPTCEESHPRKILFEYSQITQYIFIGTNACCQTHFRKELVRKCIKADLSLELERLDAPFGVSMFLWLPTKNHYPPSKKQLIIGIRFLETCVKNKVKVYVHCARGHTRAPALVIAYFMSQGMSFEKAYEKVKKKRPAVHLSRKQMNFLKKISFNT